MQLMIDTLSTQNYGYQHQVSKFLALLYSVISTILSPASLILTTS